MIVHYIHDNRVQKKSKRYIVKYLSKNIKKETKKAFGLPVYKKDWFALIIVHSLYGGRETVF